MMGCARVRFVCVTLVALVAMFLFPAIAAAQLSGAIFTTDSSGTIVNGSLFDDKTLVYLNGGPQNQNAAGLPDGTYYFQVTDPSGAQLLSADDVTCRQVVVQNQRFLGAPATTPATCTTGLHINGTYNLASGGTPVQLCPAASPARTVDNLGNGSFFDPSNWCDTTSNNGGVYKVWLTPVIPIGSIGGYDTANAGSGCHTTGLPGECWGFIDADSKTKTFKVRKQNVAYLIVCKFNDLDGNGIQGTGEPLISGWPITANGVDLANSNSIGLVNTQTDESGCVSFSVSDFSTTSGIGGVVTLTEGLETGWDQTAPAVGTYTIPDGATDGNKISVAVAPSGGTPPTNFETLTLAPGDNVIAPYFGNTCTSDSCGGNTIQLMVSKTASPSFTRIYTWGISKTVDSSSVYSAGGGTSTPANYSVSVTNDGSTDSGWQATGSIKITNPSLVPITGVSISDAVDNSGACSITDSNVGQTYAVGAATTPITIPAATDANTPGTYELTYTCAYSSLPAAGTNTATASWDNNGSVSTIGTATVDFSGAAINIVDGTVNVTDSLDSGTPTTLGTVSYTDPSPATFTYSHTFTDPAGTCTTHQNTATFTSTTIPTTGSPTSGSSSQTVKDCQGADLTVSKTATPSFTRTYNWTIAKAVDKSEIDTYSGDTTPTFHYTVTASEAGYTDSMWQVAGSITVKNPNDWEDITANLGDQLNVTGGTCTVNGGTTTLSVNRGSSVTVPYTCTFSTAPGAVSGTNTATASWNSTTAYTFDASASSVPVSFDFTTVTPTKVNATITVTDTLDGTPTTLGTLTATDSTPYTTHTYTYSHTITAPTATCLTHNNTATTGLTGTGESASQSVKVCGASNLSVGKTATPGFNSNIVKTTTAVSPVENAGAYTIKYTVTVTESGWNVGGNITVTNPNDWEAVTVNLSDVLSGASCSISGGNSQSVPAGNSISPSYSCTFSSAPSATGTNSATATWNSTTYHTTSGSASGTKGYTFGSLTVTDAFNNPTSPKTLGTISTPTATTTYTDSYSVTPTGGTCVSYPNTATITQTGQTSKLSVTVCNMQTGGLTLGYWQNKNGQAIITGFASTGGVCNLTGYLRSYAPFQDLSATATCTQVASYVSNIIKVANASGAAMNAMLKAQDLATSLDVGITTPSLANVKINLTKVCTMLDSSSGSASCSGSYINTSAAFGGAASATVSQLLTYAASQSNMGGTSWYLQNKTVQGLAKDTFDAINNQAAFIAP